MHALLCDAIDTGKSTFCTGLVQRLLGAGVPVHGWGTPPHLVDGVKEGHDFIALQGNAMAAPVPFTRAYPFDGAVPWRRWHFSQRAFDRVTNMHSSFRIPHSALFVMDEIGPLELDAHRGFVAPMRRAFAEAPHTLTVLRCGLEDRIRTLFPEIPFQLRTLAQARELEDELLRTLAGGPRRRNASS